MNTSFNDLKEIFSTPPTEARYSWIIHSGNQTLEASAVRMQPPTADTAASNSQQPPPRPPRVARTNSLNPFTPPDEVQTNSETAQMSQSQEVANKRIKTDEPEELLLDIDDQQCTDQNQQNVSPSQRSPIRPSSISPRQFLRNHARGRDQGDFTDSKENNMQQPQSSTPDSLDDYSTTRGCLGDKFNIQSKYIAKRLQSRQPCTNQNGSAALTGYQLKNMRLQEEVNSANKKIHRLNHINQNAMKRKSELQKEVLDAYKKISELEVTRHTWSEKQRELVLELKTAKQRIGDAEREAAHAIGCQSKLQRELIETESKKQKYFEGLDHAERRISKLEELMKELELESRQESLMKSDLEKRLYESEANLKLVSSDNTNLINKLGIKEKEHSIIEKRLEREIAEKEQIESKTSELVKENNHLNKELNRLESKYEMAERTIGQYSTKLSAEKEKYQLASTLKTESERELRDTKQTLMKERAQKELLNTECQVTIEKYRNLKRNYEKTSKQNELLRRENRDLKDRVLYFELYQKISDKKARPENGGTSSDKKRTTFLDTLNELKVSKEKAQIQRSRNGSRDSWDIEDGEQGAWDQSQRVQRAWGEGHGRSSKHGSNNSLDRLSEMSAQIEKLQKEQKVLNHVTAESCNGSSKAPSRINTARKSISPRSEHLVSPTRSPPKSPSKHGASLDVPNPNDTIMSFNDDEEEGDIQVGNLATFSDLLNNNTNKDIANALL